MDPVKLRTVGTTEELPGSFQAVTHDFALAVRAGRGKGVNCTLEAIEYVCASVLDYGEALVVIVAANLTDGHG
jgi:hypothetical protein